MTGIPYCDETLNVTAGCTKCSPGCLNCYAERMAKRQVAMGCARGGDNTATWIAYSKAIDPKTGKWSGEIALRPDQLEKPLHWKEPRRIFIDSMSDLFHPKVGFDFRCKVFEAIANAGQHTYLILTKRAEKMKIFFQLCEDWDASEWPNVHLGVSISTQAEADEKIPILLQIPATVRWLSIEPMLGPIDFVNGIKEPDGSDWWNGFLMDTNDGIASHLHGVIVGGESGPGARPMHPDWVRNIRDQCIAAGVKFYFKQWGKWGIAEPIPNDLQKRFRVVGGSEPLSPNTIFKIFPEHEISTIPMTGWVKVGKKKAGCLLDGREWKQLPERK